MEIIRVFPRRTKATPNDDMVRVNQYPGLFDAADEVHVSVVFSWDMPLAERLARAWEQVATVKIGGPATGMAGSDFTPGKYLKPGYVLTSRGCPNNCWFCNVWRREGREIRELPITDGWNVLDDNFLACSRPHQKSVYSMLSKYKGKVEFTGGLEAERLNAWHVQELAKLKPKQIFFAYDTPEDLEPLRCAGKLLIDAGFTTASHVMRTYVLCGYQGDSFDRATIRMENAMIAGFMPMAMLYRDVTGSRDPEWMKWQRFWARPAIMAARMKQKC